MRTARPSTASKLVWKISLLRKDSLNCKETKVFSEIQTHREEGQANLTDSKLYETMIKNDFI